MERRRRHIPGCQIVNAADADARAASMPAGSSLLARYRCIDVSCRRLSDSELWTTTRERIMTDSDVLVLRRPTRLIEWILGAHQPFLFGNRRGACLYGCNGELGLTQLEAHLRARDVGGAAQRCASDQPLINDLLAACGAAPLDPQRCVDFHPANVDAVRDAAIMLYVSQNDPAHSRNASSATSRTAPRYLPALAVAVAHNMR